MVAYVKCREKGRKRFAFLTSNGGLNSLRVHAARFETLAKAQALIDENTAENPEWEFLAVEHTPTPWASAWTGDSVGEPVNKVADPLVETLTEALLVALPYVESAEDDPAYKAGAVAKVVK